MQILLRKGFGPVATARNNYGGSERVEIGGGEYCKDGQRNGQAGLNAGVAVGLRLAGDRRRVRIAPVIIICKVGKENSNLECSIFE